MRQQKKGKLREPCIKAGAFRIHLVLPVRKGKYEFQWTSISFFVTGIPGDEEERAGMALQYPLLAASAIQIELLFRLLTE